MKTPIGSISDRVDIRKDLLYVERSGGRWIAMLHDGRGTCSFISKDLDAIRDYSRHHGFNLMLCQ